MVNHPVKAPIPAGPEGAGQTHLLIVEDDVRMQRLLEVQLSARHYTVQCVATGEEAIIQISNGGVDLVLLDIRLPDIDGTEVCRRVRAWSQVPIILVTGVDRAATKVACLQEGADDYVTKPYYLDELVARIEAVMRRTRWSAGTASAQIRIGDVTVDLSRHEVSREGNPLHLTRTEFRILLELALNQGRVLTYDDLIRAVWGPGEEDIRLLHVHVCNLRRKLEPPDRPSHIVAIPSIGYRLDATD